jgi:8-oxo-dGTP diphosphatase
VTEMASEEIARHPQEVVTCFLRRAGKVLLLRRSEKVSTFRGKWSAVSGSIETDELGQAYQEIREECGYAREELVLVRSGGPLIAEGEGRRFRVHPFLFELRSEREPAIDWETSEYRWVEPGAMGALETVPLLVAAWQAVSDE